MPKCYVCEKTKHPDEFYGDRTRSSGVSSKCKLCANWTSFESKGVPSTKGLGFKTNAEYNKYYQKTLKDSGRVDCGNCNKVKSVSPYYKTRCVECGQIAKDKMDAKKAETKLRQADRKAKHKEEVARRAAERTSMDPTEYKRRSAIRGAAKRAQERGLEFDLVYEDLVYPTHCPVLGIELENDTSDRNTSPALDRFDNDKGYTMDNVRIISGRANDLKKDGTVEEIEAILEYMKTNH